MKFSLVPALAFFVATFAGVHAQNISQCVLTCISQAAAANGCDVTSTQCLCTNSKLQQDALSCLEQSCTAQDLQNAESLVQTECSGEFLSVSVCLYLSPPARTRGLHSPSHSRIHFILAPVPARAWRVARAMQAHYHRATTRYRLQFLPYFHLDAHNSLFLFLFLSLSLSRTFILGLAPSHLRLGSPHVLFLLSPRVVTLVSSSPPSDSSTVSFSSLTAAGSGSGSATTTSPAASQTQSQSQSQSQSQNAAAPTAHAKAKLGAAALAVAVGAVVGL
uniref:GPI-anchored CFEM domain protein B n=1 Tax=Ganoderma boninense TaxID=34458 RepID=A0A5K1JWW9_9APHY|nr:GPI-anchored CFEM domain protein B [Ganoderma boninense]